MNYEDIPNSEHDERALYLDAMIEEVQNTDYQGADSEQHLLAAEALITIHGRVVSLLGDQEIEFETASISHLIEKARVHVELAKLRS